MTAITYGDHLIDSGYYDITPEQEQAMELDAALLKIEQLEERIAAKDEALHRAVGLIDAIMTNDPNEAISDAGHTALDAWKYEAESLRAALEAKP